MPCASARLAALLLFLCPLFAGFPVLAAGYQPVERPDIGGQAPKIKQPGQKPAPKLPALPSVKRTRAEPRETETTEERSQSAKPQTSENTNSSSAQTTEKTPPERAKEPAPAQTPKLFGTVEFRRPLESLPGWLDVIKRNSQEPIFIPEKFLNKSSTWRALADKASALTGLEQLRFVNKFWNGWPYREDIVNWGKQDYWAIPAQFLVKSGDCEDYAIAKYFTLKELGVNPETMRIVVLRDTIRDLAHAVLAVYAGDEIYILDNVSNVVLPHRRIGNYSPQFSINEFGRWTHIKGKPAVKR